MTDCVTSKLRTVLTKASDFALKHQDDPGIGRSFGYFTHHPVASLNRKRMQQMMQHVETEKQRLARPLRILDLACGAGIITQAFAELGHRALGVDLDADEVRLAQLFGQEQRLNAYFLKADLVQDAQWQNRVEETLGGKPDVVVLAYALHHLPEPEVLLRVLSGWLPSGSILLVNEENPASPTFRLKHRVRTLIQKDTDTEWQRTFSQWKQMFEPYGFVAQSLVGCDLLPLLGRYRPDLAWSLVFTARKI